MPLFLMPNYLKGFLVRNRSLLFLTNFLFWLLLCYLAFCMGFVYFEAVKWSEASWVAWQTFTTVGYGDNAASTTGGRLVVQLFGSWGVIVLGAIFSTVIELVIERMNKRRFGLLKTKIKDGYIAINWMGSAKLDLLVETIRAREPNVGLVIIDEQLDELPTEVINYGNIEFVKGPVTAWKTFENALVNDNGRVYVFPQNSSDSSSDAKTSKIVELLEERAISEIKIVAYQIDKSNSWMFKPKLARTAVILEHMEVMVGVQEIQDDGTGKATQIAVSNSEGVDTQTMKPDKSVGMRWDEFSLAFCIAGCKSDIPVRLFGLMDKHKKPEICPPASRIIEEEDRILLFSNNDFNWLCFEEFLIDNTSKAL